MKTNKPSTKQRRESYKRLHALLILLLKLKIPKAYYGVDTTYEHLVETTYDVDYDYNGWRDWVIEHTTLSK